MLPMPFFVSRAGEDAEVARQIGTLLESLGHTYTIQDRDFSSGAFPHHIAQAIDTADRFIAVYSPAYFAKPYTLAELYAAWARDPIGEHNFLIPVLIAPCTIPHLFR